MGADEVSEHDQLATLSYLVACLLPHLGGSARRAARARERVESRVTSSGTRGLTHRWSPPLEPGGYVSGWRVHLCNIHGRNGLHGLNSRRGHQLHLGIVRKRYIALVLEYTAFSFVSLSPAAALGAVSRRAYGTVRLRGYRSAEVYTDVHLTFSSRTKQNETTRQKPSRIVN